MRALLDLVVMALKILGRKVLERYGVKFPYLPLSLFRVVESKCQELYKTAVWEHLKIPKAVCFLVGDNVITQEFRRCYEE